MGWPSVIAPVSTLAQYWEGFRLSFLSRGSAHAADKRRRGSAEWALVFPVQVVLVPSGLEPDGRANVGSLGLGVSSLKGRGRVKAGFALILTGCGHG
jgi:hypothetical protein